MNQVETTRIHLNGIVDKVRAVRDGSDEVLYLEATAHVKMGEDYRARYGGDVTTDIIVPLPIDSNVNPGDVVSIGFTFANPFGRRFIGALTVGNEPEEEEALEVMVEEGMKEEV